MRLNPYNFKQYLAKPVAQPHVSAWVICAIALAFGTWWCMPYIAPASVALDLPQAKSAAAFSLKSPPTAFVVYVKTGFIYNNRLYGFNELIKTLAALPEHKSLLIAAASSTTLQEILPLLNKAEGMGFKQVAFTVKP